METSDMLIFILFILLGSLALIAAVFNFDWYFNTQGAAMFVKWFGRKGARAFYVFLGIILIFCGVMGLSSLG